LPDGRFFIDEGRSASVCQIMHHLRHSGALVTHHELPKVVPLVEVCGKFQSVAPGSVIARQRFAQTSRFFGNQQRA
jgi:hypothetical protein